MPTGSIDVTPGYQFTGETDTMDSAKLNQIVGAMIMRIAEKAVSGRELADELEMGTVTIENLRTGSKMENGDFPGKTMPAVVAVTQSVNTNTSYTWLDSTTTNASQSGTTVTADASIFTNVMVGRRIHWDGGDTALITSYTDSTHVTVDRSQTVANGGFNIYDLEELADCTLYGPDYGAVGYLAARYTGETSQLIDVIATLEMDGPATVFYRLKHSDDSYTPWEALLATSGTAGAYERITEHNAVIITNSQIDLGGVDLVGDDRIEFAMAPVSSTGTRPNSDDELKAGSRILVKVYNF